MFYNIDFNSIFDISGHTIIVTGGAVGIGKVYAQALGQVGANVVIADVETGAGEALTQEISKNGKAVFVPTDVTAMADCERMAKTAVDQFGAIDGLVNNAALYAKIPRRRDWTTIPEMEWDRLMAVNLKGVYNCCKAVHAQMKTQGYGKIVNISSSTWLTGATGRLHYITSKAGVVGFTRSLSHDLGREGITVNAVCPGLTKSETIVASTPRSTGNNASAKWRASPPYLASKRRKIL